MELVETMTGKVLVSFNDRPDQQVLPDCSFAPDHSMMAIHWFVKSSNLHTIEVIDLLNYKTRFTAKLPNDIGFDWQKLDQWKGNRLYISAKQLWNTTTASKTFKTALFSFPIQAAQLGEPQEETEFQGYYKRGDTNSASRSSFESNDRFVQVTEGKLDDPPDWLMNSLQWLDKKLGTSISSSSHSPTRINFYDIKNRRLIYTISAPDSYYSQNGVSPDGRKVTTFHGTEGLMMWDADPFPRWPWAWGLGILAVGLLPLVRWRWKKPA